MILRKAIKTGTAFILAVMLAFSPLLVNEATASTTTSNNLFEIEGLRLVERVSGPGTGQSGTALFDDGSVWTWSASWGGRNTPVKVLDSVTYISSTAMGYVMAVQTDGSLWAWGSNRLGQLGDGTTEYRSLPVKIMDSVSSIQISGSSNFAIKTDGSLWAWGTNSLGQLGDGTTESRLSPVKIMDSVVSVAQSSGQTMAIKADGSLWAWGSNNYGRLGDGTTTNRFLPVKIMDSVSSIQISGNSSTFAIKTDGSLWAWGNNQNGRLGDGTTTNRRSPVNVLDSVDSLQFIGSRVFALKTDRSLWGWGENQTGFLGDGTTENRLSPVKIIDSVEDFSIHDNSFVLKTDGTLWAWGNNENGRLGDGTTENRLQPVKIMDSVATFGRMRPMQHSADALAAVKTDGTLWIWGRRLFEFPRSSTSHHFLTHFDFNNFGSLFRPLNPTSSNFFEEPVKLMNNVKNAWYVHNYYLIEFTDGTTRFITDLQEIEALNLDALLQNKSPRTTTLELHRHNHYFTNWGAIITDYLVQEENGSITSVSAAGNVVSVVRTKDGEEVLRKEIVYELPIFGAFFSGEEYNYIAFGQENLEQDNEKEIVRIVRYDKDFNRIDSAPVQSSSGNQAVRPFDASTPRMAEYNNFLVLHTARSSYLYSDGLNHQINMTIVIDTNEMKPMVLPYTYDTFVSHSFFQYVLFDGAFPIFLDLGDADPRGIALRIGVNMYNIFSVRGALGANYTGVSLGGLAMSNNNYIIPFASVNHSTITMPAHHWNEAEQGKEQRDIFVITWHKITNERTQIELAKYTGTDRIGSAPYMVSNGDGTFIVSWQEFSLDGEAGDYVAQTIDENGNPIGQQRRYRNANQFYDEFFGIAG